MAHFCFFLAAQENKFWKLFLDHYVKVDQRISTKLAKKLQKNLFRPLVFGLQSQFEFWFLKRKSNCNVGYNTRRLVCQNQWVFELHKIISYHLKSFEKGYSLVIFLEAATGTITITNPKTLKLTPDHGISMKILNIKWLWYAGFAYSLRSKHVIGKVLQKTNLLTSEAIFRLYMTWKFWVIQTYKWTIQKKLWANGERWLWWLSKWQRIGARIIEVYNITSAIYDWRYTKRFTVLSMSC